MLAIYDYEIQSAIDAINAAVAGYRGLFDPGTTDDEIRTAIGEVLTTDPSTVAEGLLNYAGSDITLYVDGSSRGNPGPAGAGAVLRADDMTIACLGRPVGSNAENNTAGYAALHLGLEVLVACCVPTTVEVRIDSTTVIDGIWGQSDGIPSAAPYKNDITERIASLPTSEWTHLADSDPNPADARAAVGADIAALGP